MMPFFVSFCIFYQFLLKWRSALFQLGNHMLDVSSGWFSLPLTNSGLIYLLSEGGIPAALVPTAYDEENSSNNHTVTSPCRSWVVKYTKPPQA